MGGNADDTRCIILKTLLDISSKSFDILDPSSLEEWEIYVLDVLVGKRIAGKYEIKMIQRYINDRYRALNDPKFIYHFDAVIVRRVLLLSRKLKHTSGEFMGHLFNLQPFQSFFLANIFGWLRPNGKRRYIRSYVSMARKNGKTELMALLAMLFFLFDGENRPNVITAATQREQALECFTAVEIMTDYLIEESPLWKSRIAKVKQNITDLAYRGNLIPLSTDRGKFDGKNLHLAIIDEYHAHANSNLLDVCASSVGSRSQPLTAIITTAGFDTESACAKLEQVYMKVLDDEIEEDTTFIMIYTLDYEDEKLIAISDVESVPVEILQKSNPCWGVSLYPHIFLAELKTAKNQGGRKWLEFVTKKLNVWTTQFSLWIPPAVIKSRKGDYVLDDLAGRICFGGLDLASRRDLTSFYLHFPPVHDDEPHKTIGWNWVPQIGAVERAANDRVKYLDWINEGHLIATDGNITDYNYIKNHIIKLQEKVDILEIAYDRFNSSQLVIDLQNEGFNLTGFGQGYVSMNMPTKEIEAMYRDERNVINHNGDPVLQWAYRNAVIKMDPAGNVKVDRSKSSEKVDPVIAQIMALGQFMDWQRRQEVMDLSYDGRI